MQRHSGHLTAAPEGASGRTPFCPGDINDKKTLGRDHHYVFTEVGSGIKRGFSWGESDDFAENPV